MNGPVPTMVLEDDGRKLSIPVGDILDNVAIGYELKNIGSDTVDLYGDDSEAVFFQLTEATNIFAMSPRMSFLSWRLVKYCKARYWEKRYTAQATLLWQRIK